LMRRMMISSAIHQALTLAGFIITIFLVIRKMPSGQLPHRAMERWSAASILGGFFSLQLLLELLINPMIEVYDFLTSLVPEMVAYTLYDLVWRAFDALGLLYLFAQTPKNAMRIFRVKSPIHIPYLLAVYAVTSIIYFVFYQAIPITEVDPMDFMETADADMAYMFFILFSSCVVAPLFEEIVFRGFLLQGLQKKLGTLAATLISTVLFTLVHVQYDIWGCLSVAAMGFGAAFLTIRTGTLHTAIAYHALVNFLITMQVYYQYQQPL